ncbi:hypothetical protein [Deinococcus cellulosilyticus]|uniref:Uncharacterized protein n=1 Tax=Deinococcus cellulosilyticus (strain DSM 18568 / NBRC 106333 / KACC 11606 / 5516J-15) TaxID=1223518 RepID=A0A511NAQ9_DEIC1|nr:hypothetical protein [Deinococcus cellulosilyticus]GEM49451.1 hypothetical protein DC3_50860 [Deinococcus cellulosilyticus NBRC 106333 = KACC 11606]
MPILSYAEALKAGLSFTQYAVTTRVILRNEGGCEQFSAGWQDDKGIQNLLFVGDPASQKWAAKGMYAQDTVSMALFWDRQVKFIFACENHGQVEHFSTTWGTLDRNAIQQKGQNLVLTSTLEEGQPAFRWNYALKP